MNASETTWASQSITNWRPRATKQTPAAFERRTDHLLESRKHLFVSY